MAQIGLRDFYWNGIATEAAGSLPTYAASTSSIRGGFLIDLIQANVTITYADGEAYADDHMVDSMHDFMYADIDTQHFDIPLDVQAKLFGGEYSSSTLKQSGSNSAPGIGFGYARTIRKRNSSTNQMETIYRGYFYYKGNAQQQTSESSTTKQGSVTYNYDSVVFRAVEADAGGYREIQDFSTLAAYTTWIKGKLNLT